MANLELWQNEIIDGVAKYDIVTSDGNTLAYDVNLKLKNNITQAGTPVTADNVNKIIGKVNSVYDKVGLLQGNGTEVKGTDLTYSETTHNLQVNGVDIVSTTWYRNNSDCVVKYADGTMIIDMNIYMVVSPNTAYGVLYYCYNDLGVDFPIPFVDTPKICGATLKGNNPISCALNMNNITKLRPGGVYFYSTSALTNNTNYVEIHAVGRWK